MLPANCGGAIIEAIVAMGIVAIFLSGIHLSNSHVLQNVRSSLESVAATRVLTGRAEQLRASTWTQVTDPTFLQTGILGVAPNSSGDLGSLVETVRVTPYLDATVAPISVIRGSSGTATVFESGDGLLRAQPSVRIDIRCGWTGKGNRSRMRQMTLIVGQGGVLGRR
jgi:hypothetical protein